MSELELLLTSGVMAFMLTLTRIGTAFMIMPGIGDSFVSAQIRLLAAVAFSFVLTPITMQFLPDPLPSGFALYILIFTELIIGLFIGTVARVLIAALDTAGMIVSMQSGLANAQLFNPAFSAQGSLIGAFFSVTGVVLLFSSDLYSLLLIGLVESYTIFPFGGLPDAGSMAEVMARAVAGSFLIAVQLAAPVMVVAFLLYIGMGVLARLMPQVQVFILSLPVQILLSFLVMSLVISSIMLFWLDQFKDGLGLIYGGG